MCYDIGMRLREVKKRIEEISVDGKISVSLKQSLGNFYLISNSSKLFSLLQFLSEQKWNTADLTYVQSIVESKNALDNEEIMLDNNQYNQLNAYVNKLNEELPIFYGLVDSLSDDQNEFDINIKLSDKIKTVDDIKVLMEKIEKLEKFIDLDGKKLEFAGFDNGSSWVVFTASCGAVYGFIMACTKLAQEIFKMQEQYYKKKEARIHYRLTLKENEKESDAGLKKYCERYCEEYLEQESKEIADEIGTYNGAPKNEIEEKAKNATKCLVEIIGNGNEVHVSLNGNQVIGETKSGNVQMDYKDLKQLIDEKEETKQLDKTTAAEN